MNAALTRAAEPSSGSSALARDGACSADGAAPRYAWTTCTTQGDFRASNLTLSGRASVAGPVAAQDVDVADTLVTTDAVVQGELSADTASVSQSLHAARIDAGALRLRVATGAAPACDEGALALVRAASGADVVQACLRGANGAMHWVTLASG